jgi:hypothetical protein
MVAHTHFGGEKIARWTLFVCVAVVLHRMVAWVLPRAWIIAFG